LAREEVALQGGPPNRLPELLAVHIVQLVVLDVAHGQAEQQVHQKRPAHPAGEYPVDGPAAAARRRGE
jgi:hypothetical protein